MLHLMAGLLTIIFQTFKANDKFMNLVNNFGISKLTMAFKISIVKFPNNYSKMKKSSLSLHFIKNNFKIMKIAMKMLMNLNNIFLANIFILKLIFKK